MTTFGSGPTGDPVLLNDGLAMRSPVRSVRDVAAGVFIDELLRRDLRHVREIPVSVSTEGAAGLGLHTDAPLLALRDDYGEVAVYLDDDAVISVALSTGSGTVGVAAATADRAERIAAAVAARVGTRLRMDDRVAVTFWTGGSRQPRAVRRDLRTPAWTHVRNAYERSTREAISSLMAAQEPPGARLILWHGAPGTGKTNALRALARAWRDWCATHFITDPEQFLGSSTGYLLDVLTARPPRPGREPTAWRLVVLEDAGELLTADAHQRTGQALSRLLNTTDGLLGQGMNVITLVTTNEPLGRLHPAVTRPGRCWATVEFRELSMAEANGWLSAHGTQARVTEPTALADLYGMLRGDEVQPKRRFGFGAATR